MDAMDRIHRLIDGMEKEPPAEGTLEEAELVRYEKALKSLSTARMAAPEGFAREVMKRLPPRKKRSISGRLAALLTVNRLIPAYSLAGGAAVAAALIFFLVWPRQAALRIADANTVPVRFEVLAPGAGKVDLVGSFNDWKVGTAKLKGPDRLGYWTLTLDLPRGRHEYIFLVDGEKWVSDPFAAALKPDGFGRQNALMDL